MESQAFGRVYRMGQTKETYFARIMVRNSMDERLAEKQAKKLEMIERNIKEHDTSDEKLSMDELFELFGRAVRDEDGNIIRVESDYEDDDDDHDDNSSDDDDDDDSIF